MNIREQGGRSLERALHNIRYNIKLILGINILVVISYFCLVPILFNIRYLSQIEIAQIGEMYLSIAGIILFPVICEAELSSNINDILRSKKTHSLYSFLIRLIFVIIISFIIISSYLFIVRYFGGIYNYKLIFIGLIISFVYLGSISLTIYHVFSNKIIGYMSGFIYYLVEFFTKGTYTKDFYLFSLTKGSMSEKYNILTIIVILIVLNIVTKIIRE